MACITKENNSICYISFRILMRILTTHEHKVKESNYKVLEKTLFDLSSFFMDKKIPKLLKYENIPARWSSYFIQNFINNAGARFIMIRFSRIEDSNVVKSKNYSFTIYGLEKSCNEFQNEIDSLYTYINKTKKI